MNIQELKALASQEATNPVILGIIAHLEAKEDTVKPVAKKVTKKVK